MELTEQQFEMLKDMVEHNVFFIMLPEVLDTDPEFMQKNYRVHLQMLDNFVGAGFAEECTDKFQEAITEMQQERLKRIEAGEPLEPLARSFRAYNLTEMAVRMFSAPEGPVN